SGTDFFTALIGTGSIILIIVMQKWKRTFPAALVVVVAGILITALFRLDRHGVSIVGDIPRGLPTFDISGFNPSDLQLIFPLIVVIALVSYIESIAIAKAIAKKHGYQIDSNQELIALGFAKIGSSLFQAFPTTGGFSRSAVNEQAGGRTGMSSVFSALIIILTVLFLTPLLHYLPNAVLAAIIIVAVAGLFDTGEIANLWRTDKKDLAMLLTTFLVTLGVGIEEGIVVGVVLSLGVVIYSSTRPHSAELGRLGNTRNFRNVKRYSEASVDEDILIFRFDSPLYFASAENFRETLETMILQKGPGLKLVILDASSINHIDSTGIHTMKELIRDLRLRQIALFITSAIGPVRDKLKTTGIIKSVGRQNFFFDIEDAVSYYQKEGVEDSDYSPLQTNI
ncbi:MAG: SulP family inorganic anion transporter, partial [Balneolaceae bacterium]